MESERAGVAGAQRIEERPAVSGLPAFLNRGFTLSLGKPITIAAKVLRTAARHEAKRRGNDDCGHGDRMEREKRRTRHEGQSAG
jgi:hypothetical protein